MHMLYFEFLFQIHCEYHLLETSLQHSTFCLSDFHKNMMIDQPTNMLSQHILEITYLVAPGLQQSLFDVSCQSVTALQSRNSLR